MTVSRQGTEIARAAPFTRGGLSHDAQWALSFSAREVAAVSASTRPARLRALAFRPSNGENEEEPS